MISRIPQSPLHPFRFTGQQATFFGTTAPSASGGCRGVSGPAEGGMGFHRLHGNEITPMTVPGSIMGGAVVKPRTGPAAGGDPGG